MPKLRVAHIITQLELGGAQRNTLYTVKNLNSERFEPCLISGPGGILDEEARASGVPSFFVPTLVRPIRPIKDLRSLITLYRTLRHIQPDVVHTHSSKAGILGRIAAYLAGVPVIVHTFHGFGFTPEQKPFIRNFLVRLERFCALLSTHLVYVSDDNRRTAESLAIGPGKPTSLIRSGIKINGAGDARRVRKELNIPDNAWVVASVGNFKPQKNPIDLAKTAAAVLKEDPDVHFLFVGDGELRPQVEEWTTQQGCGERVHFLGWRQDVADILAASNTFFLTSRWEGLPRALVEAFAAQRPAVCYAVDGVQELIEEGKSGYLVPPGDVETAKQRLLQLKKQPKEAQAMGQRGLERIRKEFDIDLMVRQQETLYTVLFDAVPLKEYYRHSS